MTRQKTIFRVAISDWLFKSVRFRAVIVITAYLHSRESDITLNLGSLKIKSNPRHSFLFFHHSIASRNMDSSQFEWNLVIYV